MLNNPGLFIEVLTQLKNEKEKNKIMQLQMKDIQIKADYYDLVLNSPSLVSTTIIAKDYGWSASRLNSYLYKRRIQYKVKDTWVLYQEYADKGYTGTKTHTFLKMEGEMGCIIHTYWTQKGRMFLYELLKEDNILPLIERERTNNGIISASNRRS